MRQRYLNDLIVAVTLPEFRQYFAKVEIRLISIWQSSDVIFLLRHIMSAEFEGTNLGGLRHQIGSAWF